MALAVPQNDSPRLYTPEDLLPLPEAVNHELVGGKLVERSGGMRPSAVAAQVLATIAFYLRYCPIGRALGADASYQCFPGDPGRVRRPSVSFIRFDRLPRDGLPEGHCQIAPDLAVDVVTLHDLEYAVEERVADYLSVGVPLIWVIFPRTRSIRVRRPYSSPRCSAAVLGATDAVSGEDVLPGFSCPVCEFFR